ncbi:laccase TilA [Penicillium maclennaniae]|uniref:laccase TilA n=1 Tax=Penicillium maclennaniae TaxID=1343394 RepID=UPI00253FED2D|nr:laccase TilA [Penicillium maclennaniae]KAJ5668313.1 laccase TilA [Penicillium maclennaniae]
MMKSLCQFGSLLFLCLAQWAEGKVLPVSSVNTVRFEVNLTWADWHDAPGTPRKMIFTNGQFPGPELRLHQGDNVEFYVNNNLPNATTIHFHGIDQLGTPWSDGVPGLSQKPIPAGGKFLYKWTASQYGSYFYHAHARGQIEDGLYGPIYISPDHSVEKPFHLFTNNTWEHKLMEKAEKRTSPVMLSDWRQLTSEQVWNAEKASRRDAYCSNALMINGKGSIKCLSQSALDGYTTAAQRTVLGGQNLTDIGCLPPSNTMAEGSFSHNLSALPPTVFSGCKSHQGLSEVLKVDTVQGYVSYDLISSAGVATLMFSIDEHKMIVYAVDGQYVEPIEVDAITLANGNRYSVMVRLDKPLGDYSVRLANYGVNQVLNTTATFSYETRHATPQHKMKKGPSKPSISITGSNTTAETVILDESKVVPFPAHAPSKDVAQTHILNIGHYHTSYRWTLGNSSYPLALEQAQPLLYHPNSSVAHSDLTLHTKNNTWVDLIFYVTSPLQPPHPIHKHSNKYYVIGQGQGVWNYSTVAEAMEHIPESFNLKTPQYRDTYATPPASTGPTWLAIRYHVMNPGAFLLHCHIQVHLSGGMALALLDGVDKWPTIPEEYKIAEMRS